jgi:hypothetical protein
MGDIHHLCCFWYVEACRLITAALTVIRVHWRHLGSSALENYKGPSQGQQQGEHCSCTVLAEGTVGSGVLSEATNGRWTFTSDHNTHANLCARHGSFSFPRFTPFSTEEQWVLTCHCTSQYARALSLPY